MSSTPKTSTQLPLEPGCYKKLLVGFAIVILLIIIYLAYRVSRFECEGYTEMKSNGTCSRIDVNLAVSQFQEMVLSPKYTNQQKISAAGFLVARYPDVVENILSGKTDGLDAQTLLLLDEAKKMAPPETPATVTSERFCN